MPVKIVYPDEEIYLKAIKENANKKYITLDEINKYDILIITKSGDFQNVYINLEDKLFEVLEKTFKNVVVLPVDDTIYWENELFPKLKSFISEPTIGEVYIQTPSGVKVPANSFVQTLKNDFISDLKNLLYSLPLKTLLCEFYQRKKLKSNIKSLKEKELDSNFNFEVKEKSNAKLQSLDLNIDKDFSSKNTTKISNNQANQEKYYLEDEKFITLKIRNKYIEKDFDERNFTKEKNKFLEKYKGFIAQDLINTIDGLLSRNLIGTERELTVKGQQVINKYLFFLERRIISSEIQFSSKNEISFKLENLGVDTEASILTALGVNIKTLKKFQADLETLSQEYLKISFSTFLI